jgi:hypothetical protein
MIRWRKSSYSGTQGDSGCVEVAQLPPITDRWRKSSRSGTETDGGCVEVAALTRAIGVRDSKDPAGPHLEFEAVAWAGLVGSIKKGRFDAR